MAILRGTCGVAGALVAGVFGLLADPVGIVFSLATGEPLAAGAAWTILACSVGVCAGARIASWRHHF